MTITFADSTTLEVGNIELSNVSTLYINVSAENDISTIKEIFTDTEKTTSMSRDDGSTFTGFTTLTSMQYDVELSVYHVYMEYAGADARMDALETSLADVEDTVDNTATSLATAIEEVRTDYTADVEEINELIDESTNTLSLTIDTSIESLIEMIDTLVTEMIPELITETEE